MRDCIERFVLLPFSMGCVSESSIAVGDQFPNRSKRNSNSMPTSILEDDKEEEEEYEDDEESMSEENLKSSLNILAAPKFQKLFKNFKNISQLFKDDDDDDDDDETEEEEEDMGMEIGFPTDVKHVTHIGIDGSTTSILSKGWDDLKQPEFSPRPSVRFTPSETTKTENLNLKGTSEIAYA